MRKIVSSIVFICFTFTGVVGPFQAHAQGDFSLPEPGVMVHLSPEFTPAHLQGLTIHPDNALKFDFLINKGDVELDLEQKKQEYTKLVKYFLASLTIPDQDQWVNLSPYEHDRIIKDDFGKTEMGRDLLAQDYLLKQITSSLMYPESGLGKAFWEKVYERAWKEYGTTNVPVNTFNKVWIIPDEAAVYESGNTVYILRNHLKVMLEEDYLSLSKHQRQPGDTPIGGHVPREAGYVSPSTLPSEPGLNLKAPQENHPSDVPATHSVASKVIKQIILPELEREVNEGKNFALLRQIYSGMILATWYKHELKESLLGKVYANQAKVQGVTGFNSADPNAIGAQARQSQQEIYEQYLKAFKKGVFNYIKEDEDKYTQELIPRKYFAGGTTAYVRGVIQGNIVQNFAMGAVLVLGPHTISRAMAAKIGSAIVDDVDTASVRLDTNQDAAQLTRRDFFGGLAGALAAGKIGKAAEIVLGPNGRGVEELYPIAKGNKKEQILMHLLSGEVVIRLPTGEQKSLDAVLVDQLDTMSDTLGVSYLDVLDILLEAQKYGIKTGITTDYFDNLFSIIRNPESTIVMVSEALDILFKIARVNNTVLTALRELEPSKFPFYDKLSEEATDMTSELTIYNKMKKHIDNLSKMGNSTAYRLNTEFNIRSNKMGTSKTEIGGIRISDENMDEFERRYILPQNDPSLKTTWEAFKDEEWGSIDVAKLWYFVMFLTTLKGVTTKDIREGFKSANFSSREDVKNFRSLSLKADFLFDLMSLGDEYAQAQLLELDYGEVYNEKNINWDCVLYMAELGNISANQLLLTRHRMNSDDRDILVLIAKITDNQLIQKAIIDLEVADFNENRIYPENLPKLLETYNNLFEIYSNTNTDVSYEALYRLDLPDLVSPDWLRIAGSSYKETEVKEMINILALLGNVSAQGLKAEWEYPPISYVGQLDDYLDLYKFQENKSARDALEKLTVDQFKSIDDWDMILRLLDLKVPVAEKFLAELSDSGLQKIPAEFRAIIRFRHSKIASTKFVLSRPSRIKERLDNKDLEIVPGEILEAFVYYTANTANIPIGFSSPLQATMALFQGTSDSRKTNTTASFAMKSMENMAMAAAVDVKDRRNFMRLLVLGPVAGAILPGIPGIGFLGAQQPSSEFLGLAKEARVVLSNHAEILDYIKYGSQSKDKRTRDAQLRRYVVSVAYILQEKHGIFPQDKQKDFDTWVKSLSVRTHMGPLKGDEMGDYRYRSFARVSSGEVVIDPDETASLFFGPVWKSRFLDIGSIRDTDLDPIHISKNSIWVEFSADKVVPKPGIDITRITNDSYPMVTKNDWLRFSMILLGSVENGDPDNQFAVHRFLELLGHEDTHVIPGGSDEMDEVIAELGGFALLQDLGLQDAIRKEKLMDLYHLLGKKYDDVVKDTTRHREVHDASFYGLGKLMIDLEDPQKDIYIDWSRMFDIAFDLVKRKVTINPWNFFSLLEDEYKKNSSTVSSESGSNRENAMNAIKGGIDLNSANLNLQIKRDGRGVPLPFALQDMAQLSHIQGFEPEIIEIKPAINVPIISELQQKFQSLSAASS